MKKKIALDMFLNIVATAIPTAVLQLLILPALAGRMSDAAYGLLVTFISLFNVIPAMLGNTLNNIRLIYGEEEQNKKTSDYKVLLVIFTIINFVVMTVCTFYYDRGVSFYHLILVLAISVLWLLREYYLVAFRIKLNFLNIVLANIFLVVGYALGYVLFLYTDCWQYVYIIGLGLSLAFIFIKSDLWKEPTKKSEKFTYISKETVFLLISGVFIRVIEYADRLLIFPVLGGPAVSIYYVATVFGKVISMAVTPLSSVILSYLSGKGIKSNSVFVNTVLSSGAVCSIGYIVCVVLSKPLLNIIYPQYVADVMPYIWWTTAAAVLSAMITIINPFVMKYLEMKWQILINGIGAVVYIVVCMWLMYVFDLYGFCVGAVIAYVFKILMMLFIYKKYIAVKVGKKDEQKTI